LDIITIRRGRKFNVALTPIRTRHVLCRSNLRYGQADCFGGFARAQGSRSERGAMPARCFLYGSENNSSRFTKSKNVGGDWRTCVA
jgi:hypothetical protein